MSTHAVQLDDARLAAAYEGTSPQIRAAVKTTLALLRTLWPPSPLRRECLDLPAAGALGCSLARQSRPCGFVLAVLSPHFAAPTRLAAQIMAARLAGVERIVVARPALPDAPPFPPSLLTCLELVGVEHVLEVPEQAGQAEQALNDLLRALCMPSGDQDALSDMMPGMTPDAVSGAPLSTSADKAGGTGEADRKATARAWNSGRVLIFGTGTEPLFAPLCALAQALGIETQQQGSPRLAVDLPPALYELVHAVHPDATFVPLTSLPSISSSSSSPGSPSASSATPLAASSGAAPAAHLVTACADASNPASMTSALADAPSRTFANASPPTVADASSPPFADALLASPEQLARLADRYQTRLRMGGDFAPCWVPPLPPAFFQDHQMTLVPFTVEFPS